MADISKIKLPNDNTIYDIRDKGTHVELTQAAYDALVQADLVDPTKVYFVKDANGNVVAQYVKYSNTTSGLSATNVQAAIDEVVEDKADRVPIPASEYDSTAIYNAGDLCIHNGNVYYCKYNNITGTWNADHWVRCNFQQDYLHSVNPTGNGTFSLNRKNNTTIGAFSFAVGKETTASGHFSHSEGSGTVASGQGSHAEGITTTASGGYSHAEGDYTTASGYSSHAEGQSTIANHKSQHVFGEHNVVDPSTATASNRGNYVEIVGNGTSSVKSNARTLDWDGNEVLSGSLTATQINGTLPYDNTSSGLTATNVQSAIDEIASGGGGDYANKNIAVTFDTETAYSENDYVIYSGNLYRAKNDVSAGTWTGSTDWESVTVGEQLNLKAFTVVCTQSQYDTWSGTTPKSFPLLNAYYVITDAPNLNPTASDIEYSSGVTVADELSNKADKALTNGTVTAFNANIDVRRYQLKQFGNIKLLQLVFVPAIALAENSRIATLSIPTTETNVDIIGVDKDGYGRPFFITDDTIYANANLTANKAVFINSWYI